MAPTEEQHSTDGRLRFLVVDLDGDLTLGFDGFPWHTHANVLALRSGLGPTEAVRGFVDDLLGDRSVIALWGVPGEIRDVWVSEDPDRDAAYPIEGEVIEMRYWSGETWASARDPHSPTRIEGEA